MARPNSHSAAAELGTSGCHLLMSAFAVLGEPFPDLPASYRGTERIVPSEVEGVSERSRATLLEVLETTGQSEWIPDYRVARRLADGYRGPLGEWFEVVELSLPGESPRVLPHNLGFDVASPGSLHSLVATALLWTLEPARSGAPEPDSVWAIRRAFLPSLNAHRLLDNAASAQRFLAAALEVGDWEGPDWDWQVVSVSSDHPGPVDRWRMTL
jgi:hypothetical protein